MNTYKCVAFDLDNTAIPDGATQIASNRLLDAFAALPKDIVTVAATGRTRSFAEPIVRQLGERHDSIVANGAQIINVFENRIIH